MTDSIRVQLPQWLSEELERLFSSSGESRSEGLRRIVEEWWAIERFPEIEFRDGVSGRRASVRGGPDVWEIMMVAQDYGDDREGLQAHFAWLAPEKLDQVLAYAEHFSEQIQQQVEENERVGRLLEAEFRQRQQVIGNAG